MMDYAAIYTAHYNRLFKWAVAVTGDDLFAEDVAQNAIIHLYEKGQDNFSIIQAGNFLFNYVRQRTLNYFQARWSANRKHTMAAYVHDRFDKLDEKFNEAYERIVLQRVYDLIPKLSPGQQQLFKMVHFEGMTIAKASRILGIKESTGRVKYKDCITFFRKNIKAAR